MAAGRRRWRVAIGAVVLIAVAGVAAVALAPGVKERALRALGGEKVLVIGISQFPSGFNPNLNSHVAQSYVLGMTRRPFTAYGVDWALQCFLCTKLPLLEEGTAREWVSPSGEKGWAVDFAIDGQAVWGDGEPITTEDVTFTWEVGRNEVSGVNNLELYRRMERIEVRDDKRFTVYWNKRTCDYQGLGDFELVPAHLERAQFADPGEYKTRSLYETDTTNPGLWFGPYRVAEVELGARIVMERNPLWWGKKPYFDRIVVRVIENTAAMEANLLSGDIDYIAGEDGITLDQALAFEKRHGDEYNVVFKPGLIYEHIDLNLSNPILADARVRQALMYGMNRRAMSERLFAGKQPVADSMVSPLDANYYDGVPRYEYDKAKAILLLEEAGWTQGDDGVRRNAAGEPLKITIMTTAGNRVRELVEQVLQSQWAEIGIDVTIENQPARVLFGETIPKRAFTGMAMFAWISAPENIPRTTLHSSMIPTEANNYSGQNFTGYASEAMDEIIDRIEVECDEETQDALWRELQVTYASDLPVLPLYFRANAYVMPKWLEGVTPTGHQNPSTLWVENWRRSE